MWYCYEYVRFGSDAGSVNIEQGWAKKFSVLSLAEKWIARLFGTFFYFTTTPFGMGYLWRTLSLPFVLSSTKNTKKYFNS